VIRVSSVRHLQGLPTARRWSRKLTEPLLLLLRLAVVTLLALALARPRLAGLPEGKGSPVVLLDPKLLTDSVALATDPLLDSLRRAGAKVRLLTAGLPATPIAKPAFWYPEERSTIWDLIAQADRALSPDKGLLVIARPSPEALGGVRPRVTVPVRWHVPASPRPRGWWIGEARRTEEGITVWLFHGDGAHVCSRRVTVAGKPSAVSRQPSGDVPPLEVDSTLPRVRLLPADSRWPIADSLWTPISPTPLRRVSIDTALPSEHSYRLRFASTAVAEELGDSLTFGAYEADLRLPGNLPESVILSGALADSVLVRWPARPGLSGDSRTVSWGQLEPSRAGARGAPAARDAMRWLLILAGLVFLLERWLATRSRVRRPA
jgi:hypothetical protein